MASIDVIRSCLDSIRQISDQLVDSLLYLDAGCLEAFQFIGAFPLLLELGARAVCSLENVSPLDISADWNSSFADPAKKVVIITSRLLSDAHRYILRCLSTHPTVIHCNIFTSISEISHSAYIDSPLGPDAFHEYEYLLLQDYEELIGMSEKKGFPLHQHSIRRSADGDGWSDFASLGGSPRVEASSTGGDVYDDEMTRSAEAEDRRTRLVISVLHFPLLLCPLSPRVFVLPSEGIVAEACLSNKTEDALSPGLPSICSGMTSDVEDIPPGATLTAHFLYHLAAKMDLKMEIFSMGDLSKVIGKMLTDMSSLYDVGRRNRKTAGLLLIDRTLDLLTPCCHGDSLVDRILSSLPRRKRTTTALPVKSSQAPSKLSQVHVLRPLMDVRVPIGTIFSKEEPTMNSTQMSESITAFLSGWNSAEVASETAELAEHSRKEDIYASEYELSLWSGTFPSSYSGGNEMEVLLVRKAREGAMLIKNWLLEALKQDKVVLNAKSRMGMNIASELHSLIVKLSPNQSSLIRNRWIIRLAFAAEIALTQPHSSHWDAFLSAESILNISSEDTSQNLSSQIRDFINTSVLSRSYERHKSMESSQSLLSLKDALLLSMTGYILAGENFPTSGSSSPFSWEEEHSLKEAVVDAILEKPASAKFHFLHGLEKDLEAYTKKDDPEKQVEADDFDDQWGSWDDEETDHTAGNNYGDMQLKLELRDRVDHLFKLFHQLSSLKQRNTAFVEHLIPAENNFCSNSYPRKGLLYRLLTTVLVKSEIPGLQYHSSTVGRFLKSGFGRFGLGQAKPILGDQSVILIFVVGGITNFEVREVMEAVSESSRPDTEFILGGTTLLCPDDMFELLLGSSSYI